MANLLDIVTKVDRPTFTVDGTAYEMRHPNEFSMTEFHLLQKHGVSLQNSAAAYADDPERAYDEIMHAMTGVLDLITPDLPGDLRDSLNPYHVQQLMQSFTQLAQTSGGRGERQNRKKSSRGSSASTPARRPTTG